MSSDEVPEGVEAIDLEAFDLGPLVKRARAATFAPNWRSVLAADALVGLLLIGLGVVARLWITILGWFTIAAGVVYLFLVFRRFLQWRWLRRQVGLS